MVARHVGILFAPPTKNVRTGKTHTRSWSFESFHVGSHRLTILFTIHLLVQKDAMSDLR